MKYIKKFLSFGKSIDDICKKYGIENYTINQDGSIDVDGNVYLYEKNLTKLPLKFGKVSGNFYCYSNNLTSLEGSPNIVGGSFYCYNNKLTSLEGSPNRVGGNFDCYNNKLTNLEGYPDRIGGDFYCDDNTIYNIYKLFNDHSQIELFNDYDIIRDNGRSIVLDRLNAFLEEIGKDPVDSVKGYKNI